MATTDPTQGIGANGLGTDKLAEDRALLGRTSTAERVADILRTRIAEGFFPPGERLAEDAIGKALGVSRNTLREAFRLLTHERLLVHELNRGVFVRVLAVEDVADIYRTRRLVECAVVQGLGEPPYRSKGSTRPSRAANARPSRATGRACPPPTSTSTANSSPSRAAPAPTN